MGLDASVRCHCFEEGRYSKPPFPIRIDEAGYPAPRDERTPAEVAEFHAWLERACEHGETTLASEWISNWTWVKALHRVLHTMPEGTPRLLKALPTTNSGLVCSDAAASCLAELNEFERLFRGELSELLDREQHFRVVAFRVVNGDAESFWEDDEWEFGRDGRGAFFRQRAGERRVVHVSPALETQDGPFEVATRRAPCLEDDWSSATIDERIAGVWTLTRPAMGWNSDGDVPRLQNKRAAAGAQDLVDVRWLEEHPATEGDG